MARIVPAFPELMGGERVMPERPIRRFGERRDDLERLTDNEFRSRLRMNKHTYGLLYNLIEPDIAPIIPTNHAISAHSRLQLTLRFLATGTLYQPTSDLYGISKASMSRHLFRVVTAITDRVDNFIYLPRELQDTVVKFFDIAGMPNVIGAIDGTHVAVMGLPAVEEEAYVNRKGFHSINVQAICDADRLFTNVVARWPGSAHDNTIFTESEIFAELEAGVYGVNRFLLGDSGYGVQRFLMTPFQHQNRTPAEEAYNRCHKATRVVIERAFGELKSRFRCLNKQGGALYYSPEKCLKVIGACFCLHNMCKRNDVEVEVYNPDPAVAVNGDEHGEAEDMPNGMARRRILVENNFAAIQEE